MGHLTHMIMLPPPLPPLRKLTVLLRLDENDVDKVCTISVNSVFCIVVVEKPSQGPYTIPPPIGYPTRDVAGGDPVIAAVETKSKGDDDGFASIYTLFFAEYSHSLKMLFLF
ncbi:hypothetical protein Bca52824_027516 [Brassica carinata]|uniref:Uncharacterized protein n=1 Tax=Brassica carinata TaxID=52824 RepID=A0A8X7VAN4_BRACI|nr:hypothetical protein Bca52824_027516 [Brassica carinata]